MNIKIASNQELYWINQPKYNFKLKIFNLKLYLIIVIMEQQKIIIETLINIDSSDRNINPKNICISNNKILPMNPISLINSNELKFNYPNHNLQIGDKNDAIVFHSSVACFSW